MRLQPLRQQNKYALNSFKKASDIMNILQIAGNFKNDAEKQAFIGAVPVQTAPQPTLADIQASRSAYVNAMREQACEADVQVLGHSWQADKRSKDLLNGAISLAAAGLPLPATWRTTDNIDVQITVLADLLAIAGAMASSTQAAYSHSWALKAQIKAATDATTIQSIIW
jgi:hypothetical protein